MNRAPDRALFPKRAKIVKKALVLAIVSGAFLVAGLQSAAAAPRDVTCGVSEPGAEPGFFTGTAHTLTVPANGSCDVAFATITQDLIVQSNADLFIAETTIGHDLTGVPTAPADVVCGQTLTASTTLANDLVDCPGTALVVGAGGITIDLNGHTVDGTSAPGSEGVADDGYADVRITNGTIQQFRVDGVGLRGAPGSVVANLTVRDIGAGRGEQEETAGVAVLGSPESLVVHSRLDHNCLDGVLVSDSPKSRVVHNELNGNCNDGITVRDSDSTSFVGNHESGNQGAGIGIINARGASIIGNHVEGSFFAFVFSNLRDSEMSLNDATGNFLGMDLFPESTGNRFVRNSFSWNRVGIVIESDENLVAGNVVNHNQNPDDPDDPGGGIGVFGTRNTIRSNVADANGNANGGDGIFVGTPGNTLTANGANRNGGHGIEADSGTIDGGGNHAHANGLQPDCIGVVCG